MRVRDVAGERQIAKRADDQATARSEDASGFPYGIVLVEPPPALTGTHEIEALRDLPGVFRPTLDEVSREPACGGRMPCNFEQFGCDVEARGDEPASCESESEGTGAGPEIERGWPGPIHRRATSLSKKSSGNPGR